MYLARKTIGGQTHYIIRQSYLHEGRYLSRDLVCLGKDPARFIIYPGGNAFYIDEDILDRLSAQNVDHSDDELEDIFWPFLKPRLQRALEHFRHRAQLSRASRTPPAIESSVPVHAFDKRRIYFLRCGRMDQRNISRVPPKLFRMVHEKSRDEIEHAFIKMERQLSSREYKAYTYTIFDLQHFFYESFANQSPELLNPLAVDDYFIEAICNLNADPEFWSGMQMRDRLQEHLVRYAVMYFDYDFAPRSFVQEYIRDFIHRHRTYQQPFKSVSTIFEEASGIFGESVEVLKKMTRSQLAKQYRRQAQKYHPDKGGVHDKFVRLTQAYHDVLRTKR